MNCRTGRNPAVRPAALRDLEVYSSGPLPTPPPSVVVPKAAYPIDGNAKYGCCTLDGVGHLKEAWHAKYNLPYTGPTEAEVVKEYFAETGGPDTGLNEADVLKKWCGTGLFGSKLIAYAPVDPKNLLGIHQSVAFYDGAYLGIKCPQSAQRNFANGEPWKYEGEETEDGHCVVAIGYNDRGELEVATWGGIATLTPGFCAHYLDEAWCLISGILQQRKGDSLGIDITSLRADLARV